jgi:hypothetical protein
MVNNRVAIGCFKQARKWCPRLVESESLLPVVTDSDVCFYSCITKELLSRDEFVRQIDYYATQLKQQKGRR